MRYEIGDKVMFDSNSEWQKFKKNIRFKKEYYNKIYTIKSVIKNKKFNSIVVYLQELSGAWNIKRFMSADKFIHDKNFNNKIDKLLEE